jgi:RecA-family ATPase
MSKNPESRSAASRTLRSFTAAELLAEPPPVPTWVVPGLLPAGVTVLAGSPKVGKSYLSLQLAASAAAGSSFLGHDAGEPAPVLYAALEDGRHRLHGRLKQLGLDRGDHLDQLHLITHLSPLPDAVTELAGWLQDNPSARLIIIDVLERVRPHSNASKSSYSDDYALVASLRDLALQYGIAIVVIHHLRKAKDSDDVFKEISGSTGLTGAADQMMHLDRPRNTKEGTLQITGRCPSGR